MDGYPVDTLPMRWVPRSAARRSVAWASTMSNDLTPDEEPAQGLTSTERRRAHRRVTRRRYIMRRVVALAVVVLAVLGVTRLVGALVGGTESSATAMGSDASSPVDIAVASTDATGAAPTIPGSSSDTTAPPSTDPSDGVPSASAPAKLLIVGDSDAGTFGPYLQTLLDETGVVASELDYKVSSGLSRPDFFDWPSRLETILPQYDPDIVVVTFGGNDAQGLTDASGDVLVQSPTGEAGGDEEWRAEYQRRVTAVLDQLGDGDRTVIWVGIPNAVDPDFTARLRVQDETVRAAISARPATQFVDTWARFSGREGNYAEFVIDPRDGLGKDVRAEDGFHLNVNGAEILALDIAEVVKADLRARGAAI